MSAHRLNALVSAAVADKELTLRELDDELLSWNGVGFFADADEHAALSRLHEQLERDAVVNNLAQAAARLIGRTAKPIGLLSSDATRATLGAFIERNRDTTPRTLVQHLSHAADGFLDKIR
jgi:hypothetical protein